ncbi:MAG TPA: c-type cytochrome [Rhizomicrobium sp.]|jgi:mono/diheme cytochrome c family protein|nr:c-type cytochrome [Rhizomicrobium sp.]
MSKSMLRRKEPEMERSSVGTFRVSPRLRPTAARLAIRSSAIALLLAAPAQGAARDLGKVEQGKNFAIESCSACHVVRPGQKPPPPVLDSNDGSLVPAPSFMDIARTHGTDRAYLRRHIVDPTWPMRQQLFDDYYLDDIILYIRSLDPAVHRKPNLRRKGADSGRTPARG